MRLLLDDHHPPKSLTTVELERLYAHPIGPAGRWLRTNFVCTLDGAAAGEDRRTGSINTESDRWLFGLHRAHADVIMVGAGTVRAEGYRAVDLNADQRAVRERAGLSGLPTLVVITSSLDVDPMIATAEEGDSGPVIIATVSGHEEEALRPFGEAGVEIWAEGTDTVDLPALIARLTESGRGRILAEGGPGLNLKLLAADLVDEVSITIAPTVVGGDAPRTATGHWLDNPLGFRPSRVVLAEDHTLFLTFLRV